MSFYRFLTVHGFLFCADRCQRVVIINIFQVAQYGGKGGKWKPYTQNVIAVNMYAAELQDDNMTPHWPTKKNIRFQTEAETVQ